MGKTVLNLVSVCSLFGLGLSSSATAQFDTGGGAIQQGSMAQDRNAGFFSMGGAAGGGQGGRQGNRVNNNFPKQGSQKQYGFFAMQPVQLILTPSDVVEYEVDLEPGQTIFASVDSQAFDPALEIMDESKEVLASNDDQYPGEQSPFISYFSEKGGKHKVIVKNYRSTSGGAFTLYTKTFKSFLLKNGKNVRSTGPDYTGIGTFHLVAEKGKQYCLSSTMVDFDDDYNRSSELIITPNGLTDQEVKIFRSGSRNKLVFEAKQSGDYYFVSQPGGNYVTSEEPVASVPVILGTAKMVDLNLLGKTEDEVQPGDAVVFKGEVKPRDIWITKIEKQGQISSFFAAPPYQVDGQYMAPSSDNEVARNSFYFYPSEGRRMDAGGRIFLGKGTCYLTSVNVSDQPARISISNTTEVPTFNPKESKQMKLGIGQYHFYRLNRDPFDDFTVKVSSDTFEPVIETFDEKVGRNTTSDLWNHAPIRWFYGGEKQSFLMIVGSVGGGGSGNYTIEGSVVPTTEVKLDETVLIGKTTTSLAKFQLKAMSGQKLVLTATKKVSPEFIDDSGKAIPFKVLEVDGLAMYYFDSKRDQIIRIRLNEASQGTKFKIAKYRFESPV